ncbi:MAG: FAD-binding protein [Gemmatimonadaceae bacterium]|nr:FAD-binding protein [Gemmatimonadaceae bacterium]
MTTSTSTSGAALGAQLAAIVGDKRVLQRSSALVAYTSDGLPGYQQTPSLAVFPGTRDELIGVVRTLAAAGVPFVPRGAGTGLSGGALADGTVLIGLNRLTKILSVDPLNRVATVEPGVVNTSLQKAAAVHGLHYAPDPSSQSACTIGGNVAENAGGPHCLKYGVTLNHTVACTVILPDGEIVSLGAPHGEVPGYDLLGAFVGSEGCFGIALDCTVRLLPNAPTVRTLLADFMSLDAAARATSAIIASGILPAALEMMDGAAVRLVEASVYAAGYPTDCEAVLLVDLDGVTDGLDEDVAAVDAICREHGARRGRASPPTPPTACRLWQGRKKAFGAMGRLAPALVVQDAVVPRTKLPDVLREHRRRSVNTTGVRGVRTCSTPATATCIPNIPYNATNPDESARVHAAMGEIMQACMIAGGTITGEHGVGLDKMARTCRSLFDARLRSTQCAGCAMCSIRSTARTAARWFRCTPAANGTRRPRAAGDDHHRRDDAACTIRARGAVGDRRCDCLARAAPPAGGAHLARRGCPGGCDTHAVAAGADRHCSCLCPRRSGPSRPFAGTDARRTRGGDRRARTNAGPHPEGQPHRNHRGCHRRHRLLRSAGTRLRYAARSRARTRCGHRIRRHRARRADAW